MSVRRLRNPGPAATRLDPAFDMVRVELQVPADFPAEVVAEVQTAAATPAASAPRLDATQVPFVTIDPPESMDLDQAMHIERLGDGWRVRYAIADVAAFVLPGGQLDAEAHRRGETLYSPDLRTPLYPNELSEGAASLLPDQVRPALLWSFALDSGGGPVATDVRRALVRSREKLDYAGVQRSIENGTAAESLRLLREVGEARQARALERGAVDLRLAEQEVVADPAGGWRLEYRAALPVESWNAQISLLTGMAAARLMLAAGVGVLRTLPPADRAIVESLRRSAVALGVDWPAGRPYAEVVSALDAAVPAQAAVLELATRLLRGAAYVAFAGGVPPAQPQHSAVAAPYAHTTAPLRRLVDRYVGEVCLAVCAGAPVPEWVATALPALPAEMAAADRRAHALDRAVVDLMEATVLAGAVGTTYDAVVVETGKDGGEVQLRDPAVRARCRGHHLPLGQTVRVRLTEADQVRRRVSFALG
jgi:exoribonuclease R